MKSYSKSYNVNIGYCKCEQKDLKKNLIEYIEEFTKDQCEKRCIDNSNCKYYFTAVKDDCYLYSDECGSCREYQPGMKLYSKYEIRRVKNIKYINLCRSYANDSCLNPYQRVDIPYDFKLDYSLTKS